MLRFRTFVEKHHRAVEFQEFCISGLVDGEVVPVHINNLPTYRLDLMSSCPSTVPDDSAQKGTITGMPAQRPPAAARVSDTLDTLDINAALSESPVPTPQLPLEIAVWAEATIPLAAADRVRVRVRVRVRLFKTSGLRRCRP